LIVPPEAVGAGQGPQRTQRRLAELAESAPSDQLAHGGITQQPELIPVGAVGGHREATGGLASPIKPRQPHLDHLVPSGRERTWQQWGWRGLHNHCLIHCLLNC
jgi:hypothetical protein